MFLKDKYCPCSRTKSIDKSLPIVEELSVVSVDYINNVLLKSHQHLCASLRLKTIIRAEVEELPKMKYSYTHLFIVLFEVSPSDGIFESSLLYNEETKNIKLRGEILRINLYGQTSACIRDKYSLRSFCYCISQHRQSKSALPRFGHYKPHLSRSRSKRREE